MIKENFMEVYADNAATTKVSKSVIKAMLPYFDSCFGNPSSVNSVGQKAKEALCSARETIARILNCDIREIIFTSGGSEADNQAIISAAKLGAKNGKKHIISTTFEHHAVLNTLKKLEKEGFEITLLEVPESGIVDVKSVEDNIKEDTCLVSVMFANNEIGTIQPIKEIGEICRSKNVLFHTDAVQAAGHILIDVKEQNIDLLSLSAHKFHGPKGVGVLYVKRGIQLENIIEGGGQERGKRAGTENVPAIVGMSVALENAYKDLNKNQDKLRGLQAKLIEGLSDISYSILNGTRDQRLPNNVNMCFEGIDGEAMLLLLNERGIYASSGSACTAGSLEASHVLLAIGRSREVAKTSLRLTLSEENTEKEIDYIIKNVKEVVAYLRKHSPMWSIEMEQENIVDKLRIG